MGPGTGLVNYGLFRPELGGGTRENIHKVSFCLGPVSVAYINIVHVWQIAAACSSHPQQPATDIRGVEQQCPDCLPVHSNVATADM